MFENYTILTYFTQKSNLDIKVLLLLRKLNRIDLNQNPINKSHQYCEIKWKCLKRLWVKFIGLSNKALWRAQFSPLSLDWWIITEAANGWLVSTLSS